MVVRLLAAAVFVALAPPAGAADPPGLHARLAAESPAVLARDARARGDAGRGAALFFQPALLCAQCHDGGRLAPDVAAAGRVSAEYLIESVLVPSKVIKAGYEAVTVVTTDGRTVTGLVAAEAGGRVTLRDPAAGGKEVVVPAADIESRTPGRLSPMPDGLADGLADRQQFLDLAKYLIDVAEGGPARAKELRPPPPAPATAERDIDHAGLIRAWDAASLTRGEAVYARVCANCHGTLDRPGSLPTAPRFAAHTFKNGADPHALYRTLTAGYGQMPAQAWMTPRQKYDVVHYLRETVLKPHNPARYTPVDAAYLAGLPKGTTFGPAAPTVEAWAAMDYGPSLLNTVEVGGPGPNIAYKGVAVRLDPGPGGVSRGKRWAVYDHDTLRLAAAWTGTGFIDWAGIAFDGRHGVHPRVTGDVRLANPPGPGWADPVTGSFADPRPRGRDGRPYGPLPAGWAKFRGLYHFGDLTVLACTVGGVPVLELAGAEADPARPDAVVFTRTLEVGASGRDLLARVAPAGVAATVVGDARAVLEDRDGFTVLRVRAGATPVRVKVLLARGDAAALRAFAAVSPPPRPLEPLTRGGPRRWPEVLKTPVTVGKNDGPFAVDTFALPDRNPWNARLRLTGFDFFPGGKSMAVCSWDGDVWVVSGLDAPAAGLTWRRVAAGLFQPLGLKARGGDIFVACRDQIVRLRDLNGDGETDFTECFNSDHQVTEHFHEFAMGLQTDAAGNFFYAKSGRHALPAVVPHHGTLLKVSADGSRTDILATGFRAANGVCLNPDGTFFVTDQEGFWTPKNRINLVKPGGFYGNMWGYTDVTDPADAAMEEPVCWVTNAVDRSPAELVWVTPDAWGPLKGSLLNLSYGHGKIYVVPHEVVAGRAQGGVCALPLPLFPTGIMRGRFHPADGALYACGMSAWAANPTDPGGFFRVRPTGKPAGLPVGLRAKAGALEVTFTDPLDPASATDPRNYELKAWGLTRSAKYGSAHVGEHAVAVAGASVSADGKTVRLAVPALAPTRGMEVKYRLRGADGRPVAGAVHNTIHALGP